MTDLPPAPLKLRPYGAIQICLLCGPPPKEGVAYCVALCLSVCLSVRLSRYYRMKFFLFYSRTVLRANIQNRKNFGFRLWASITYVIYGTCRGPHIVRPSRPHKFLLLLLLLITGQGHCNACHKKWGFTDNELFNCGETQTMSHINSCPLTIFDGGLLHLYEADEAAVDWLTTYGS